MKTILLIAFVCLFSACIHEYPDDNAIDPTLVHVDLSFSFDTEMLPYVLPTNTPAETPISFTAPLSSLYQLRYIVEIYTLTSDGRLSSTPIKRFVANAPEVKSGVHKIGASFALNAVKYRVLTWVDYQAAGTQTDKYYQTQKLTAIQLMEPYVGSNDYLDAFSNSADLDLTAYRTQYGSRLEKTILLKRPFAKVKVITNDLKKYLTKNTKASGNLSVEFKATGFFPTTYNATLNTPNDAKQGFGFRSQVQPLSDTEALLGYDFVFVGSTESAIIVNMFFYDNGKLISQASDVRIPIKRGYITTIRDEFLTKNYAPGVGIDTDFAGEIDVTIPD